MGLTFPTLSLRRIQNRINQNINEANNEVIEEVSDEFGLKIESNLSLIDAEKLIEYTSESNIRTEVTLTVRESLIGICDLLKMKQSILKSMKTRLADIYYKLLEVLHSTAEDKEKVA
ncbi:hypothetical protein [Sporocytophaga myxococcoides]|uniref:hypothetical protein n=1 Tax=Sporocytophaga myxococcoides TaxID=153721 RepID=UPI00048FE751|nr:hypothetical protein [Sporocytophaga myxococcoides]